MFCLFVGPRILQFEVVIFHLLFSFAYLIKMFSFSPAETLDADHQDGAKQLG